jgi:hypothetical protein
VTEVQVQVPAARLARALAAGRGLRMRPPGPPEVTASEFRASHGPGVRRLSGLGS